MISNLKSFNLSFNQQISILPYDSERKKILT
jgi:hypothetical protein